MSGDAPCVHARLQDIIARTVADRKSESPTAKGLDPRALEYTASVGYDNILYSFDITASIAHARMLGRQGIISLEDANAIERGLNEIREEIERGDFKWREELEDVHMNIEARLTEKIGSAGRRLHTARSRNDQVATDMRMFVLSGCGLAGERIAGLQEVLLDLAEANIDAVMPGYTHLQRGQPVLLSHHLLAYFEMLDRDGSRLLDVFQRANELPLGSGALAGVSYPIDRDFLAEELEFDRITGNSIDAVSDRDFIIDFHAAAAVLMMHLSRMAEEIVLWSSEEFGFVELPAEFATGSSIMPQKRNPDVAELARSRTGRVYGNLMSALTMMKGLPLAYNRDFQEDKQPLFESMSIVVSTLEVLTALLTALRFDVGRMEAAAGSGYALATDLADYLVRKGMTFRDAHQTVAELVRFAQSEKKLLADLSLKEYRSFSPLFGEDVLSIDVRSSIAARDVPGGTAPNRVKAAIADARKRLKDEA